MLLSLALLALSGAQEDVQVTCQPEEMRIQVTKAVVESNGFAQQDVHLTVSYKLEFEETVFSN